MFVYAVVSLTKGRGSIVPKSTFCFFFLQTQTKTVDKIPTKIMHPATIRTIWRDVNFLLYKSYKSSNELLTLSEPLEFYLSFPQNSGPIEYL